MPRKGQPSHHWPGVGRHAGHRDAGASDKILTANASWFGTLEANVLTVCRRMTARRCAKVLAGGAQFVEELACVQGVQASGFSSVTSTCDLVAE